VHRLYILHAPNLNPLIGRINARGNETAFKTPFLLVKKTRALVESHPNGTRLLLVARKRQIPRRYHPRFFDSMKMLVLTVLTSLLFTANVGSESTNDAFFPPDFDASYYPGYLRAAGESSLFARRQEKGLEAVRFLWIRSFQDPVIVRIERTVGQAKLRAIRFRKRFGEQPQAIISDRTFEINTASWQEITNKVTQSGFWKLSITDNITGFDGSRWVLEAVRDGQYKVVDRWYPNEMTAERDLEGFKVLCVHILQLGDVLLKGERIY